jgi:hypothetical protein
MPPTLRPSPSSTGSDNDSVISFYNEHCTYLPPMLGWFLFSALLSKSNNEEMLATKNKKTASVVETE